MSIADELDQLVDGVDEPKEAEPESTAFTLDDLCPSKPIYFDIETGPEPDHILERFFEFDETKAVGYISPDATLDESVIKYGAMGPDKRAEKLKKARAAFLVGKANSQLSIDGARDEAWRKFVDKAALSPITGRVLAIGYGQGPDKIVLDYVSKAWSEVHMLNRFWAVYGFAKTKHCKLVGFNSNGFDVPFLVRRSLKCRSRVPDNILVRGRVAEPFCDVLHDWQCGQYREYIKLNTLAKYFGLVEKTGDGAEFARLFFGTPEEHARALAYLSNDIDITMAVAKRLGR